MYIMQGTTRVEESSGWSLMRADVSEYACNGLELRFHLDGDDQFHYAGLAIDDVRVSTCTDPGHDFVVGEGLGFAPGQVTTRVRIYDGTGAPTAVDFQAYGSANWGTNVSAGAIDADGIDEILTGPGPGDIYGPHVRAWHEDGSPAPKVNFYAYFTLRFGVNVTTGDVDMDGFDEIVTGAGPGAVFGPHVRGLGLRRPDPGEHGADQLLRLLDPALGRERGLRPTSTPTATSSSSPVRPGVGLHAAGPGLELRRRPPLLGEQDQLQPPVASIPTG